MTPPQTPRTGGSKGSTANRSMTPKRASPQFDSSGEGSHGAAAAQLANIAEGDEEAVGTHLAAGLYLVATPIGNLGDLSARAVTVLDGADVVACEDTRVTAKLLHAYHIDRKTVSYNDHNGPRVRPRLIKQMQSGGSVALVSDAGTPVVSDPGYKLVQAAHDAELTVTAVPGASAVMASIAVAGIAADRFMFAGFLPPKTAARRAALAELAAVPGSLVFFESPRRLAASLADMARVLGDREAAVTRELTKLYEEVVRGSLHDLAAQYGAAPVRGEIVVVVGPPVTATASDDEVDAALATALSTMSVRDAVATVSGATGRPRRAVYERALALTASE